MTDTEILDWLEREHAFCAYYGARDGFKVSWAGGEVIAPHSAKPWRKQHRRMVMTKSEFVAGLRRQSELNGVTNMEHFLLESIASELEAMDVVWVPKSPTPVMVVAMADCYDPTWGYPDSSVATQWARESYQAMLAAAENTND